MLNRRGFIGGLVGLLAAPALVRATSLDYAPRGLILPEPLDILPVDYFRYVDHSFGPRRYYEHAQRPKRHLVLSYHVPLGAILLAGGLYYFSYAFRLQHRDLTKASLAYLFLGISGVMCGVGLLGLALRAYLFS